MTFEGAKNKEMEELAWAVDIAGDIIVTIQKFAAQDAQRWTQVLKAKKFLFTHPPEKEEQG